MWCITDMFGLNRPLNVMIWSSGCCCVLGFGGVVLDIGIWNRSACGRPQALRLLEAKRGVFEFKIGEQEGSRGWTLDLLRK